MVRLRDTVIFFLFVVFKQFVDGNAFGKLCNPHSMRDPLCSQNETCNAAGRCECRIGFTLINSTCQNITTSKDTPGALPVVHSESADSTSGHVAAGILIPLFLLAAVVICGIFLNHKYRLVSWVRNKISQRNSTYDEVMIGQDLDDDDPPLH